jgi:SAM-dependent methyltransferase
MTDAQTDELFRHDAERYDAMIDWQSRLAFETPFYQQLFAQVRVKRVLDAACGTGRHAVLFHSWGLEVEGADISPAMIEYCRAQHGEPQGLRWVERPFDQPPDPPGAFDAVICVGNSLSLVPDTAGLRGALRGMLAALRPGGVCVAQVLNLWRLPEGPTTWQKCKRLRLSDRGVLLLKGIHRVGGKAYIDVLEIDPQGSAERSRFDSRTFLGLEPEALQRAAEAAGADDVRFYGSFEREPYERDASPDIVMMARRHCD